jgi:thiol-disulfide isomerase/thioredoxin
MNRRTVLCCMAGLVLGLMAVPSIGRGEDDTNSLVGKPAPDFTLNTIDAKEVKLSDLKGDVVVLDFWATWCPPCRKSLPHLNKVANDKELAEKGFKVFAVNCRETKDKAENYLKTNNLQLNVPLDVNGATMKDYMVQGIPTTVIVGRDGKIKNVFVGFGGEKSEKDLDEAVAAAVKEPKPAK